MISVRHGRCILMDIEMFMHDAPYNAILSSLLHRIMKCSPVQHKCHATPTQAAGMRPPAMPTEQRELRGKQKTTGPRGRNRPSPLTSYVVRPGQGTFYTWVGFIRP